MYVQIFSGIAMIIFGICHLLRLKILLGKDAKIYISEESLSSFQ